jgi:mRNA interferase YafQ
MLKLFRTKTFLKEYRKIKFTDKLYLKYILYVTTLLKEESLPKEAKEHPLKGNYANYREFHIRGDLLLIYKIENKTLKLVSIGTHSELFS